MARNIVERIFPLDDVDRPSAARLDDKDGRPPGQRLLRPGEKGLGAAADLDMHFARAVATPCAHGQDAYATDAGLISRHGKAPLPGSAVPSVVLAHLAVDNRGLS